MSETLKTRYFVKDDCLVSTETGEENLYFFFKDGKWKAGVLMMGFLSLDDEDPDGTIFSIGCLDSLIGFEEISEEAARDMVIFQTLDFLRKKWETRLPGADVEVIQKHVEAELSKYGISIIENDDGKERGDGV